MILASAQERAKRPRCAVCDLPLRTCVCGLASSVANRVDVLVLQHPHEAHEAKGSARLLRLSLARCRVVVGEVFDAGTLFALLHAEGARSVLLYPADVDAVAPAGPSDAPVTQLVVLDATWRKSLRMLKANALLQSLPRLGLMPAQAGRYGALRKARLATQLSTLEATCQALAVLEGDAPRYVPLLEAFERFVRDRVARAAQ